MVPILVQVQFSDHETIECPVPVFRRRLKGSGIELDRSYPITRVAPGRFVGRGFMTPRARAKSLRRASVWFVGGEAVQVRARKASDLVLFEEIRVPESVPAPPAPELAQADPEPGPDHDTDEGARQTVGLP